MRMLFSNLAEGRLRTFWLLLLTFLLSFVLYWLLSSAAVIMLVVVVLARGVLPARGDVLGRYSTLAGMPPVQIISISMALFGTLFAVWPACSLQPPAACFSCGGCAPAAAAWPSARVSLITSRPTRVWHRRLSARTRTAGEFLKKVLDNAYRVCYSRYNDVVTIATSDGRHAVLVLRPDISDSA